MYVHNVYICVVTYGGAWRRFGGDGESTEKTAQTNMINLEYVYPGILHVCSSGNHLEHTS